MKLYMSASWMTGSFTVVNLLRKYCAVQNWLSVLFDLTMKRIVKMKSRSVTKNLKT